MGSSIKTKPKNEMYHNKVTQTLSKTLTKLYKYIIKNSKIPKYE